ILTDVMSATDKISDLPDLVSMLPEKDRYIQDLINSLLCGLGDYDDCVDTLIINESKGAFSIDLSDGRVIVFKPSIEMP
ncbi:hypothetical protein LCGC14_1792490, partial [marine sediment metagenome]